jgi:ParB family transcriptional regulator, chromosome partitioning protein
MSDTQGSRGGLGRGLSAILSRPSDPNADSGAFGAPAQMLREVPVELIGPNPRQPRAEFDEEALQGLAASIREVGLLQPIVVRETPEGKYELIAGERRWRACRLAGLTQIPAIVRPTGDDSLLIDALVENIQREDLDPLEEAAGFRQLVDDFGATHEEVARRVGRSRAAVTNALRLLSLAPEVQARIRSGALSAAHGRAIAALTDPEAQARAALRAVAESMSVRATEELVRTLAAMGEAALTERSVATRAAPSSRDRAPGIAEAEMLLSDILSTRVTVESRRSGGKIVIEFADIDDLDRIVRQIER